MGFWLLHYYLPDTFMDISVHGLCKEALRGGMVGSVNQCGIQHMWEMPIESIEGKSSVNLPLDLTVSQVTKPLSHIQCYVG